MPDESAAVCCRSSPKCLRSGRIEVSAASRCARSILSPNRHSDTTCARTPAGAFEQPVVGDERARHAATAALAFAQVVEPQRQRFLERERFTLRQRCGDLDRPAHEDGGARIEVEPFELVAPERRRQRQAGIVQQHVLRVRKLASDQCTGFPGQRLDAAPLAPALGRGDQRVPAQAHRREQAGRSMPRAVRTARSRPAHPEGAGTKFRPGVAPACASAPASAVAPLRGQAMMSRALRRMGWPGG